MGLQLILSVRKEAPLRSPSIFNHKLSTILVVIITRLQMPLLKPFDQEASSTSVTFSHQPRHHKYLSSRESRLLA